jgi:hypothetical protein
MPRETSVSSAFLAYIDIGLLQLLLHHLALKPHQLRV